MMDLTLETMVSSSNGTLLKNELVIATIINHACPSDLADSHVISGALQTNCPSLFEESDFVFYKVKRKNNPNLERIMCDICTCIGSGGSLLCSTNERKPRPDTGFKGIIGIPSGHGWHHPGRQIQ